VAPTPQGTGGRHVAPTFTDGWARNIRTANTKLTKLYRPSRKCSPKWLIVLVEPKSGGGTTKKNCFRHFAPDVCPPTHFKIGSGATVHINLKLIILCTHECTFINHEVCPQHGDECFICRPMLSSTTPLHPINWRWKWLWESLNHMWCNVSMVSVLGIRVVLYIVVFFTSTSFFPADEWVNELCELIAIKSFSRHALHNYANATKMLWSADDTRH